MMTDDAGNILWQDDVTPFGEETGESGCVERDGFYTGKKIDRDTGLYYFNSRWYDPELGRFITEDPVKDGTNWFSYVANNPLRYTDPTGLRLDDDLEEDYRRSQEKAERETRKKDINKIAKENNISTKHIRYDLQITIYRKLSSYLSAYDSSFAGQDSMSIDNNASGESMTLQGLQTVSNHPSEELSPNGVLDTLSEGIHMIGRLEPEEYDSEQFSPGQKLAIVGGETLSGRKTNIWGVAQPNNSPKKYGYYVHSQGLAGDDATGMPAREGNPLSAGCPMIPSSEYKRGSEFLDNSSFKRGEYIPIMIILNNDLY